MICFALPSHLTGHVLYVIPFVYVFIIVTLVCDFIVCLIAAVSPLAIDFLSMKFLIP